MILTDEFARQASMEQDLGIESTLFAAPAREIIKLGNMQIGFMNMFAIPLFQGVTDVMPAMAFSVDELQKNESTWKEKINEEQAGARRESDASAMNDGMFSPRTMSVATPSDASQQKKGESDLRFAALLNSRCAPTNGVLKEGDESHHHSMPDVSADGAVSPPETSPLRSRPTQLQLSFATASAPRNLDHPAEHLPNGDFHINGIDVKPSLVTDPVVAPSESSSSKPQQRSSDGTEASSPAAGDWASQATSVTTSKMPLSPSTQGTSIMSRESNEDKRPTPTGGSLLASTSAGTTNASEESQKGAVVEKVRNLKKKPSRFRIDKLNFWKRSKSASPPEEGS
jgi:3',5'-cyclic-nucleotide phosphodiesterase